MRRQQMILRFWNGKGEAPNPTEPWHADALRWYLVGAFITHLFPGAPAHVQEKLALLLGQAELYLWRSEMLEVAEAVPVPSHVVRSTLLQHDIMLFVFDSPVPIQTIDEDGVVHDAAQDWVLLHRAQDGFTVETLVRPARVGVPQLQGPDFLRYEIAFGSRVPDDYKGNTQSEWIVTLMEFLNTRVVEVTRVRHPRVVRRSVVDRAALPDQDLAHSGVNVVALRRREPKALEERGESEPYPWKHQWIVSGHWRLQWMPSLSAHEPRWVEPYLKGPPDKPLLKRRVYAVVR